MTLHVFSFGGGRQSMAALVLAAQGLLDFQTFLFCNVGADSENPATLAYVDQVARPFALAAGLTLIELHKVRRTGDRDTLLDWALRSERSVKLPLRPANSRPGNRSCTEEFKISVIDRWLKANGATATDPADVGIGISLDEFERARTDDPRRPWEHKQYPLIARRLSRTDCTRIIAAAGLPVPPKSSCWFCPFHRVSEWQTIKRETPALFEQSVALERTLSARSTALGRPALFLTGRGLSLDRVVGDQAIMDFEDTCESGYCMT